ncbi:hypothetical protein K466DRAFT_598678 [Polyporus arcularius HHB13444]|uniref:Uncharacterized protein n=1 Tax=Polyporus arcularius HHB13444 TaxID=1314778 RepID=A0A5C3PGJ2_9APHY|nr:hypothetical protein K466DRAFT_598678 [Polyporus arcularius HHB13444]
MSRGESSQLLHQPSQPAASSSKSPEPAPAPANDEDIEMLDEEQAAKKIEAEEKTLGAEAYLKTRDCDNTIVQQMMSFKQFLEREAAEVDDMQSEEAVEYCCPLMKQEVEAEPGSDTV